MSKKELAKPSFIAALKNLKGVLTPSFLTIIALDLAFYFLLFTAGQYLFGYVQTSLEAVDLPSVAELSPETIERGYESTQFFIGQLIAGYIVFLAYIAVISGIKFLSWSLTMRVPINKASVTRFYIANTRWVFLLGTLFALAVLVFDVGSSNTTLALFMALVFYLAVVFYPVLIGVQAKKPIRTTLKVALTRFYLLVPLFALVMIVLFVVTAGVANIPMPYNLNMSNIAGVIVIAIGRFIFADYVPKLHHNL